MKKYKIKFIYINKDGFICSTSVESDCFENLKKLANKKIKIIVSCNAHIEAKDICAILNTENKFVGYIKYYLEPYFYDWNEGKWL